MRSKTRRLVARGALCVLVIVIVGGLCPAHHAVLRFNLEEMTQTADRIFVGECVDVVETTELIAQGMMPVTRYTFSVERAIKGSLPRRVTFSQLGHAAQPGFRKGTSPTVHGEAVSTGTFIHGMSQYSVGDRLLLFLIPDYLGGKVTYPVGLYQGAFKVSRMPSGQQLVRNNVNNIGLFTAPYNGTRMTRGDARMIFPESGTSTTDTIESLSVKRGGLPLEQFLSTVEQIHAAHGGPKGAITQ